MKHCLYGVGGTLASISLEGINALAGAAAGVLTAAYMGRKLYLSFREKRHRR